MGTFEQTPATPFPSSLSGKRRTWILASALAIAWFAADAGAQSETDRELLEPSASVLAPASEPASPPTPRSDRLSLPPVSDLLARVQRRLDRGWGASDGEERLRHYRAAEAVARRARARAPSDPDTGWWLVAALGLRAQEEPLRHRPTLAREIRREARRLVERAPEHAGGHHALGRLHASVLRPGRIARWLARGMGAGELLEEASWEEAESHLRKAVELEPDAPHHRVELARILRDRGRAAEAREMARSALYASDSPPLARWYKGWARELLDDLEE